MDTFTGYHLNIDIPLTKLHSYSSTYSVFAQCYEAGRTGTYFTGDGIWDHIN